MQIYLVIGDFSKGTIIWNNMNHVSRTIFLCVCISHMIKSALYKRNLNIVVFTNRYLIWAYDPFNG